MQVNTQFIPSSNNDPPSLENKENLVPGVSRLIDTKNSRSFGTPLNSNSIDIKTPNGIPNGDRFSNEDDTNEDDDKTCNQSVNYGN